MAVNARAQFMLQWYS